MHQPAVRETRKPFERIVVGEADRFTTEVARCHHQYRWSRLVARQPEQQRMQRGVGHHDAKIRVVRRDRIGDGCSGQPRHQHDGPLWTRQHSFRCLVDRGDAVCGRQVGHHDRERLVAPPLSAAQFGDRAFVGGVAGQVVSTDALDGQHAAVAQQLSGVAQRRFSFGDVAVAGPVAQGRPAVRAADRLGVEPPVGGIVVFACALGAHREAGHGGGGAVVRQRGDDGEARAAVGAVDEGVPVAPVGWVALFGGAFGAHGDVGGGERAAAIRS